MGPVLYPSTLERPNQCVKLDRQHCSLSQLRAPGSKGFDKLTRTRNSTRPRLNALQIIAQQQESMNKINAQYIYICVRSESLQQSDSELPALLLSDTRSNSQKRRWGLPGYEKYTFEELKKKKSVVAPNEVFPFLKDTKVLLKWDTKKSSPAGQETQNLTEKVFLLQ